MSKKIHYDTIVSRAKVEHPYEGRRCVDQIADIVVLRDKDYGSVYECDSFVLNWVYGALTQTDLEELGIFVLEIFENIGLRKSTFSICKDFVVAHSSLEEYESLYKYFIEFYKV